MHKNDKEKKKIKQKKEEFKMNYSNRKDRMKQKKKNSLLIIGKTT